MSAAGIIINLLILIGIGALLFSLSTRKSMEGFIKQVLYAALIILIVVWMLKMLGLLAELHRMNIKIPAPTSI